MSDMQQADIAYLTDLHFSTKKNPKWFGGSNYFQDQIKRFKEAIELAKLREVKYFLLGGDLFDQYNECDPLAWAELEEAFNMFNGRWYIAVGNHDLLGKSLDGFNKSGIKFFLANINHACSYPSESVYCPNFHLSFGHWGNKLETELRKTKELKGSKLSDQMLAVIHSPIGPKSEEWCIGVDELSASNYDLVLFGDQHEGWEPRQVGKTIIANPGSFSWNSIKDMSHTPKIGFYNLKEKLYWEEDLSCPVQKEFEHKKTKKSVKAIKEFKSNIVSNHEELVIAQAKKLKSSEESVQCLLEEIQKGS